MPLPEPKGHRIPINEAAAQTKRARQSEHKGGLFLRKEIDELLAQPGCSGIRYYYGLDANGEDSIILVGVDKEGNDMVNGMLVNGSFPCPPFCGGNNALNS